MEGNDIGVAWNWHRRVGVMFEQVLVSPPPVRTPDATVWERARAWWKKADETPDQWLGRWVMNPKPLRSLRRIEGQYRVPVEVYTFLEQHTDRIEAYLHRWGLQSARVVPFFDVDEMVDYIGSTLEVVHCWVPEGVAEFIGPRATVATTTTELSIA